MPRPAGASCRALAQYRPHGRGHLPLGRAPQCRVVFFSTDDIQSTYEELKGRGVEFAQEPTEQPYGIDAGFRDPSGNSARMMQSS